MQKLIWTNAKGNSVDLTSGFYGITNWEGFSNSPLNIQSQQVPFNDVSVFLDGLIEPRELSVTLAVNDNGDLHKRYELRRELISILNPKLGEGYLIYKNDFISKRIKCTPQIPIPENHNSNDVGTPKINLSWTACDPYWEDLDETSVIIFPGLRNTINNEGDVPSQVKIDLFTNNVTNPEIKNLTENKKIKLNGNFINNISINTQSGNKLIEEEGLISKLNSYYSRINSICYSEDKNLFVAVGQNGTILTSSDGENFVIEHCEISGRLNYTSFNDVVYAKNLGLFVIVGGGDGTKNTFVRISSNGKDWEIVENFNPVMGLHSICYSEDKNLFVAVGIQGSHIYTSSDGVIWNDLSDSNYYGLSDVIYSEDKNLFVAVGQNGKILKSSNGISWVVVNSIPNISLSSICYSEDKNLFVAVGQNGTILTSSEGTSWTSQTSEITNNLSLVTYVKELNSFITFSNDLLLMSSDGIHWTKFDLNYNVRCIIYAENLGLFIGGDNSKIISSVDCINWFQVYSSTQYEIKSVAYSKDKNLFVAVGQGDPSINRFISTSSDGINWINRITGNIPISKVIYAEYKKLFIGVGDDIEFSSDGITWNSVYSDNSIYVTSICYSEKLNLFVAIGYTLSNHIPVIITSSDGINWNTTQLNFTNIVTTSICYSEKFNLFVAVGKSYPLDVSSTPFMITSSDGINWDNITNNLPTSVRKFNDIIYSEELNLFIAIGDEIIYSQNGITWILIYPDISSDVTLYNITYDKNFGLFISTGNLGTIYISCDGINWNELNFSNVDLIYSYSINNNNIIITGVNALNLELEFSNEENLISNLTSDSDMTLGLQVGKNELLLSKQSGNLVGRITYRQKYIGV